MNYTRREFARAFSTKSPAESQTPPTRTLAAMHRYVELYGKTESRLIAGSRLLIRGSSARLPLGTP